MKRGSLPETASELARTLQGLKQIRRKWKNKVKEKGQTFRGHLTQNDRDSILRKTGSVFRVRLAIVFRVRLAILLFFR